MSYCSDDELSVSSVSSRDQTIHVSLLPVRNGLVVYVCGYLQSQLQHSRSLTDVAALLNQQNNSSPSLHFQRIAHANDTTAGGNHSDSSLYATAVPGALLSTSASGDYARRESEYQELF